MGMGICGGRGGQMGLLCFFFFLEGTQGLHSAVGCHYVSKVGGLGNRGGAGAFLQGQTAGWVCCVGRGAMIEVIPFFFVCFVAFLSFLVGSVWSGRGMEGSTERKGMETQTDNNNNAQCKYGERERLLSLN